MRMDTAMAMRLNRNMDSLRRLHQPHRHHHHSTEVSSIHTDMIDFRFCNTKEKTKQTIWFIDCLLRLFLSDREEMDRTPKITNSMIIYLIRIGFATNGTVPQPPAPPSAGPGPAAAVGGCAPPPPPPPPMGGLNQGQGSMDMSSLASQLQQAKLKRNTKSNAAQPPAENSGSSTSSGGSNYSTGKQWNNPND